MRSRSNPSTGIHSPLSFSLKQNNHLFFFGGGWWWWSVALTEYHVGFCPHDIHFQSLETVLREQMRHMDTSYGINMHYGKFSTHTENLAVCVRKQVASMQKIGVVAALKASSSTGSRSIYLQPATALL